MRSSFRRILIIGISLFLFLCAPKFSNAQPDPNCDPLDPACPIDNGLVILIAIGAAYGIKKVVNSRKAIVTE
jgi:hypothetical protein